MTSNDWWQHAVIYQIYPRSFMDSNGDGIGDLRGIIQQLPHLADIGVTATWLSPIFASPMVDFGYDISDFKAIQPEYGTMQDFEDLLLAAEHLNIKVLLDFVPNHTSDQCAWFQKSVEREIGFENFYIWDDGKLDENGEHQPPNNWNSVFYGSAWTWHEKRQQYYLHQFTKEQPDLNFRNPAVIAAMDDIIHFWLDKGVAGFRIDAVSHIFEDENLKDEPLTNNTADKDSYSYTEHIYTKNLPEVYDLLQHWRSLIDDYTKRHGGSTRIILAEAWADIKTVMDYYETATGVRGVHFPFNFNLITESVTDARDFVSILQKWLTYMPRGHIANWVIGNHDTSRVATRFGQEMVDPMNMVLLTLPGVAVTYNGEEIGMQDFKDITWEETVDPPALNVGPLKFKEYTRDPARTPFQWSSATNAGFSTAGKTWLPVNPNYVHLNLDAQKETATSSHYKVYKALTALRQLPVLRKGRTEFVVVNRNVFLVKRELKAHEPLVTIINLGSKAQRVDLTEFCDLCGKLKVLVASAGTAYENGIFNLTAIMELNAYEAFVLMGTNISSNQLTITERREIFKTVLKSLNIILVGLLMYKLWNNKWTNLQFYDKGPAAQEQHFRQRQLAFNYHNNKRV